MKPTTYTCLVFYSAPGVLLSFFATTRGGSGVAGSSRCWRASHGQAWREAVCRVPPPGISAIHPLLGFLGGPVSDLIYHMLTAVQTSQWGPLGAEGDGDGA